jgi:hypothetical protein
MNDAPPNSRRPHGALLAICSGVMGAAVVAAGFKFSFLNWILDVPGWLVSRIVPIDFHEGEGALGFFVAIALSWAGSSLAIWGLVLAVSRQPEAREHDRKP